MSTIEQGQFVHYVPELHDIVRAEYHQRATVVKVIDLEHVNLHIPQGPQGKGWLVNPCQVIDNVPYSATCEPGTWHEVDIKAAPGGEHEHERCCKQFAIRVTHDAYMKSKQAHSAWWHWLTVLEKAEH